MRTWGEERRQEEKIAPILDIYKKLRDLGDLCSYVDATYELENAFENRRCSQLHHTGGPQSSIQIHQ